MEDASRTFPVKFTLSALAAEQAVLLSAACGICTLRYSLRVAFLRVFSGKKRPSSLLMARPDCLRWL